MVMAYASPIVVHETISTDSVNEKGAFGDLHLLNDHQSEELDRSARFGPNAICAACRCCKPRNG